MRKLAPSIKTLKSISSIITGPDPEGALAGGGQTLKGYPFHAIGFRC